MVKIIAELCQNHNGDWNIMKDMIHAAAESGAHYAKSQSMLANELTFRERFENGILEGGEIRSIKRPFKEEYERLKPLDLTDENYIQFIEECNLAGIEPLTTIFTRQRIPFVKSLGMNAVKVASYDCGSYPLIEELSNNFEHLYISTGASFDEEIEKTSKILQNKKKQFSLLHCVTIYPTPMEDLNLNRMNYLRTLTPNVGFSDHTLVQRDGINASLLAIAYGANIVERHFTVLPQNKTRDGPVSINPRELSDLIKYGSSQKTAKEYITNNISNKVNIFGNKKRSLSQEELLNRDYYRGRFASKINGEIIYNWETKKIF